MSQLRGAGGLQGIAPRERNHGEGKIMKVFRHGGDRDAGAEVRTMSETSATPGSRRWLILGTVALAQLMVVLDATIVNIALPSAQRDLGFSTVERQWVVTAYALAFGSLLLLGGRLGDLIGRKVTFLAGALGFAAASAMGGAATSFGMLATARAARARSARCSRPRPCQS